MLKIRLGEINLFLDSVKKGVSLKTNFDQLGCFVGVFFFFFDNILTILDIFGLVQDILNLIQPFSTHLDRFGPIWSLLNRPIGTQ